jgi:hypothetical protein
MIDNLDTIRVFNSLKNEFPKVKDIFSVESDYGGSIETFIFDEGGETQFYLTKQDQNQYIPTILSYHALQKIIHIIEPFDKTTHLIHIDRSTNLIELDNNTFKLIELKPLRSKITDTTWEPVIQVLKDLKLQLNLLNYTYNGIFTDLK